MTMISSNLKRLIVVSLVITTVASSSFLLQPKPVDAATQSCLMSALGPLIGGIKSAIGGIMSVPVTDKTTNSNTATNAGADVGSNIGECLLKTVARMMAQTFINKVTQSTISWINGGFNGSPAFITDPEGFLAEVGDITGGQFITQLGLDRVLCSPFDAKIRVALGLNLGTGRNAQYQYLGCRLSDVQKNIYNSFVGGKWGEGNQGWQNFISISQGSNNPYGAYLYGKDALSQRVASKVNSQLQELNWGSGFLSQKICTDLNTGATLDPDELSAEKQRYYDPSSIKCTTVTPGSVIQEQLNKTLGNQGDVLNVSQNIDDIIAALSNYVMKEVFSSSGLLGLSYSSAKYGNSSYLSTLGNNYEDNLADTKTKPPAGVNCALDYKVDDDGTVLVFQGIWQMLNGKKVKGPNGKNICDPNLNPGTVESKCFVETSNPNDLIETVTIPVTTPVTKPSDFEKQIQLGCKNLAAGAPVTEEINNLASSGGILEGGGGTGTPPPMQDVNLAIGKGASQSTTFDGGTSATQAIDGNLTLLHYVLENQGSGRTGISGGKGNCGELTSGQEFCASQTTLGNNNWWELDLKGKYDVKQIQIYQPVLNGGKLLSIMSAASPIEVRVSNIKNDPNGKKINCSNCIDGGDSGGTIKPLDFDLTEPTLAQYVRVIKPGNGILALGQIIVWGNPTIGGGAGGGGGAPSGPTHSAAYISSDDWGTTGGGLPITLSTDPNQTSFVGNNGVLTITSPSDIPELNVKVSLVKSTASGTTGDFDNNGTADGLASIFKTFSVSRSFNASENNLANLLPLFPAPISGGFPGNIEYVTTNNAVLTSQGLTVPTPPSGVKIYYLKIGGYIPATLPGILLGTYQLIVNVSEKASGLAVGTQTYTFTINCPYGAGNCQ
ncbi:MAG TPA: hypothetical protein VJI33_02885 [Candidatus Paceibacterota bacterium]